MPLAPLRRAALCGLLCATVAASSLPAAALAGAEADAAVERVRRGVVVVVTHDESGRPLLRGSGFFVAGGKVVTSLHVLRGASGARVLTHDGQTHRVESIAGTSRDSDLALLEVSSTGEAYAALEVEREMPQAGSEVAVVGGEYGARPRVTRGSAGGVWYLRGAGELIQISARIAGGNSGGPVVNREGKVVGVAALFAASSPELNFAVTSGAILDLLSHAASPARPDTLPRQAGTGDTASTQHHAAPGRITPSHTSADSCSPHKLRSDIFGCR